MKGESPAAAAAAPGGGGGFFGEAGLAWWWVVLNVPFVLGIKLYQVTLSPILGRQCRYHPTCSWYGLTAYRRFGPVRGTVLTGWRILRCHPFVKGGVDEVPGRKAQRGKASKHT